MVFFKWKNKISSEAKTKQNQKTNLPVVSKKIIQISKKFQKFNSDFYTDLKKILISFDLTNDIILKIIQGLKLKSEKSTSLELDDILPAVKKNMVSLYQANSSLDPHSLMQSGQHLPQIWMVVGVNGSGKTTSLAKIAYLAKSHFTKILLVAADTFRSGAVKQLEIWSQQLNLDIVEPQKLNQDPSSVVFTAIAKAQKENYDLVLIDTAGRLQNKVNLMQQLAKVTKTIDRFLTNPRKQRIILLAIDANIGRNGLQQAKVFTEVTQVNGLILTKIDGSAKGGIIFSIKNELHIPVLFQCFGEQIDDIKFFQITDYVNLIL